jgi:hypothetical protein
MESKLGLVAQLIKKQTNRAYFSEMPIGTTFIIVDEHDDMPTYELTGYFLNYPPQILPDGRSHFTGYIEKGSWEIIGSVNDIVDELRLGIGADTLSQTIMTTERYLKLKAF